MFRTGYEFLSNSCACTCMFIAIETASVPEINICDIEIDIFKGTDVFDTLAFMDCVAHFRASNELWTRRPLNFSPCSTRT